MTEYINQIFNEDCMEGLDKIPDYSVDLVVMDPPYKLVRIDGIGLFGSNNRDYYDELSEIRDGITDELLTKIVSKMKKVNIYIWCNKEQIQQYLEYFSKNGKNSMDLLTWHKTNPIPTCSNKYLSDTEYCLFFREKGVKLYGSYNTKHKYYVSSLNTDDKKLYNHPTVKPLNFIRNMIANAIPDDGSRLLVMDPFMGSGTTAVAAKQLGQDYVGFEINPEYHRTALQRVESTPIRTMGSDHTKPVKATNLADWGL